MSENVTMTQWEFVRAQREAFAEGVRRFHLHRIVPCGPRGAEASGEVLAEVDEAYPFPKVERPRVVADPHAGSPRGWDQKWRCVDNRLQWQGTLTDNWYPLETVNHSRVPDGGYDIHTATPERIALWADLLAGPTELVDADV